MNSNTTLYQGWPEVDESKKLLIEQVHEFAEDKIKPLAAKLDATGEFPTDLVRDLAEMGIMGMMVPETWGGAEMDTVSYAMVLEEIAAACASTAVITSVNNSLVCAPLNYFGNDLQKKLAIRSSILFSELGQWTSCE
jgi:butyryl-CoA dehydrogenase